MEESKDEKIIAEGKGCAFCEKEPAFYVHDQHSFHATCDQHSEFHATFNVVVIQKKLGIITEYPDHFKTCFLCKKELTVPELNSIQPHHYHSSCFEHRGGNIDQKERTNFIEL